MAGLRTVGLHAIGRVGARCNDVKAMDLVQKNRPRAQGRAQLRPVGCHALRVVADARAEVEAIKRCQARATGAGGTDRTHTGRRWPLRAQPIGV